MSIIGGPRVGSRMGSSNLEPSGRVRVACLLGSGTVGGVSASG